MKLIEVQNWSLNRVKKKLQQHVEKHGYTTKPFAIGNRNFSFDIRIFGSFQQEEYVLILREDNVIFIMKDYDEVCPSFDEIWDMIVYRYRHPFFFGD